MDIMELVENEMSYRPFQCDWHTCHKSFQRNSDLQRHYRIHTNERPYSCMTPGCDRRFIQKSALTVHIRTHTGEKPYRCHNIGCGKQFSDSSSLARHRRIHTGKMPYKCARKGCSKSFCRKVTLIKHHNRSHQHGNHSSKRDTSDSKSGESSTTPQQSHQLHWPPNIMATTNNAVPYIHHPYRLHSFADFEQQLMNGYSPHNCQNPLVAQVLSLPVLPPNYAAEQNDPGVVTLITNAAPTQTFHRHHQDSQQMLQSSTSIYSPISRSLHPLQNAPPAEQQPIVQFQQFAHRLTQQQYYATAPQDQWYDNITHRAPIDIGHIQDSQQTYVSDDPWIQKIESFDNISFPLPGVRIENL